MAIYLSAAQAGFTRSNADLPATLTQFDNLPDSAHVQVRTVAAVAGVSTATVWRMVQRGTLPAPKKFSVRATRWNVGELRRALAAR